MADFRRQAEQTKLARLLRTSPESLNFLDTLDSDALNALRQAATGRLHGSHHAFFSRVAAASKLLPTAMVAFIAQRSIGPLLCARVADAMSTERAIAITSHLPAEFMAAATPYLDSARARELTAALPLPRVIEVTHALIRKREFITLGDLVGNLPMSLIGPILQDIDDGEALLQSGFYVEAPERLNEMLEALPRSRLPKVIAAAADEKADLWPHALALMSVVSARWQERLVLLAVEGDESVLESMIRGVVKHDLWNVTLPLLELMPESGRQRLVNLPVLNDDAVLRRLLEAATRHDLWHHLLPLAPLMNTALRQRMGRLTDELNETSIRRLVALAHERDLWSEALFLVEYMGKVRRATIAELMAESNDEAVNSLIATVQRAQQWQLILPLLATMTEKAQQRFVGLPLFRDSNLQRDILLAADQHGLWSTMLPLLALMPADVRRSVAQSVEQLDAEAVRRWSGSIREPRHWQLTLAFTMEMSEGHRAFVAEQFSQHDDIVLHSLLQAFNREGQWQPLLDFLMALPAYAQQLLMQRAGGLDPKLRLNLLRAAAPAARDILLQRLAELPASEHANFSVLAAQLPDAEREGLRLRCRELGIPELV
ncbi:MAG: hypothetical protein ACRERR_04280 [Moraxellaceae bacterium]